LRSFEEEDVGEEYLRWLNDPEVTRYLGIGKTPATPESVRRYLRRFWAPPEQGPATDFIFAILDSASNQHIGNVTLNRIDWTTRVGDTGMLIGRKEFWGKGYAFEAWSLLLAHAFKRLGLRKILAGAVDGHTGSLKVLERLGFRVEGVLRGEFLLNGEYRDVIRMGLFREELR
jgi:RimJ/RimL family protein N-acetyltransferase